MTTQVSPETGQTPVLEVDGLEIDFYTARGWVPAVTGVSFTVARDETLAIVGESGSGKTVTSLAVMGLLPAQSSRVRARTLRVANSDVLGLDRRSSEDLRGKIVSMIFQEPMTSLNPAFTVGDQIAEVVRRHERLGRRSSLARAVELLDMVGIPNAQRRLRSYPHEFSGGMRQRVMIAMALACKPQLLIADEPTTALDVTVQSQILYLIDEMRRAFEMSVLFITHDMGVVAEVSDRAVVMYAGHIIEHGLTHQMFSKPLHPYTSGLLRSMPALADRGDDLFTIPGRSPELGSLPDGCRFEPRCAYAEDRCRSPQLTLEPSPHAHDHGCVRCIRAAEFEFEGVE